MKPLFHFQWQFLVKDPGETGVEEDKTWLADEGIWSICFVCPTNDYPTYK